MPFVQISQAYPADPANIWQPKSSFISTDPFALVIRVQISSDLIQAGLRYDAIFQMDNPRRDPFQGSWFYRSSNGSIHIDGITRDHHWNNIAFQWTDFAVRVSWPQYLLAVSHISGGEKVNGVFLVRGTINVRGSNLFAHSRDFPFKVVP